MVFTLIRRSRKIKFVTVLLAAGSVAFASGCAHVQTSAPRIVQQGERVDIDYTCRIEDGQVVTTTDQAVAERIVAETQNTLFRPRRTYEPLGITAGQPPQGPISASARNLPTMELLGMHEVIEKKLAGAVVGKPYQQRFNIEMTAETQNEVPEPERMIRLSRARSVAKTLRVSRDEFMKRTGAGRPAEVGMRLSMHQGMDGKVAEVAENEVVIEFTPRQTEPVMTPFGERVVFEHDGRWVIRTETEVGHLVRTGPQIGRISKVEPGMFEVDYSNPFGGETLVCDVMVRPAETQEGEMTAAARTETSDADSGAPAISSKNMEGISAVVESDAAADPGDETGKRHDASTRAENDDVPESGLKGTVEKSDLVEVSYSVFSEDGGLLYTTEAAVADNPDIEHADFYRKPGSFGPEIVTAGEQASTPGIGDIVIGMTSGESRKVVLPPQQAFGAKRPSLVKQYDAVKRYRIEDSLTAKHWMKKMETFPVQGKTYSLNPYLDATVEEVTAEKVAVRLSPRKERFEEEFGTTTVKTDGEFITVTIRPKMGVAYAVEGKQGRIVASDERSFTVDYNHPLAGTAILLDVRIEGVTKAAELAGRHIHWIKDYGEGLSAAEKDHKPAVMVLYAAWCGYSKKLLAETLTDPRIRLLSDDFVWVKIDTHEETDIKALYEQQGYPLTVVLNAGGDVVQRIDGFKDATFFYQVLKTTLHQIENEKLSAKSDRVRLKRRRPTGMSREGGFCHGG